jgi:hypothetical protein
MTVSIPGAHPVRDRPVYYRALLFLVILNGILLSLWFAGLAPELAAEYGILETVQLLLAAGAKLKAPRIKQTSPALGFCAHGYCLAAPGAALAPGRMRARPSCCIRSDASRFNTRACVLATSFIEAAIETWASFTCSNNSARLRPLGRPTLYSGSDP